MTQQTLASNVALMAGANEDAIEIAIREYARLVYRISYVVLRNHHDAEDATQETFVRVLRYRRKLEGVRDAKTWLARIAWRVAVKRARRMPVISLTDVEMRSAAMQLRSEATPADETLRQKETAELLASLISVLPEPLRDTLRLSTVDELSVSEIAQVLDITESSVRSRLFRARQILKERFISLGNRHGTSQQ